VTVALLATSCSDDSEPPRSLAADDFEAAIDEICEEHGRELDALTDELTDEGEVLLDTDPEVEAWRRELIELKRNLVDDLRAVEPAARAAAWRAAVEGYEDAIERAAANPRVDVQGEDLTDTRIRLTDEFGLDGCF
jgi:hypothetical protein